jgi:hypothetical protein
MRVLVAWGLLLSLFGPANANAQTGVVDLSVSYRFMRAGSINHYGLTYPTDHSFPKGGEAGVVIRVAPVASLVATVGRSSSRPTVMSKGGIDSLGPNPSTGTVTYSIADFMGGVKFSRDRPSPFVQLMAGVSAGSSDFKNVSGAGQSTVTLDQGTHSRLAARAEAGLEARSRGSRFGVRVAAGFDFVVTDYAGKERLAHFRLAAGLLIRLE